MGHWIHAGGQGHGSNKLGRKKIWARAKKFSVTDRLTKRPSEVAG